MPTFSFLKGSKGGEQQRIAGAARNDSEVKFDSNDSTEKVQRRQSKRNYFRSLLKISSLSSESRANRRKSGQFMVRE